MISKNKVLLMMLSLGLVANLSAEPAAAPGGAGQLMKSYDFEGDERCPSDDCFDTALKVEAICAKRLKSKWIDACNINVKNVCAESIKAKKACLEHLVVNEDACIKRLQSRDICADNIRARNLCLGGDIKLNQTEICQKFRATVVFGTNQSYTLGAPLNFDTILDDPNNNVTLAPFGYHAPVKGYYTLTVEIDQNSLIAIPANPVLGVPVANVIINVNGSLVRQTFVPYLSFHNDQVSTFSSLIRLNAGDVVTAAYEIIVLTDTGVVAYPSTTTVLGNGNDAGDSSLFQIHYLSTTCTQPICEPCFPECGWDDCKPEPKPDYCKPDCKPGDKAASRPMGKK